MGDRKAGIFTYSDLDIDCHAHHDLDFTQFRTHSDENTNLLRIEESQSPILDVQKSVSSSHMLHYKKGLLEHSKIQNDVNLYSESAANPASDRSDSPLLDVAGCSDQNVLKDSMMSANSQTESSIEGSEDVCDFSSTSETNTVMLSELNQEESEEYFEVVEQTTQGLIVRETHGGSSLFFLPLNSVQEPETLSSNKSESAVDEIGTEECSVDDHPSMMLMMFHANDISDSSMDYCDETGNLAATGECIHHECKWDGCFKMFAHLDDLVNHVTDTHVKVENNELFRCRWLNCPRKGKGFNARYKVLIHVRTHTNEKPHVCVDCGKSFSRLENLKIHKRTHTGERPYTCPYEGCGKAYTNSSDRFKHALTHRVERPYACKTPGCGKKYTDPSSLRKHVRTHGHSKAQNQDEFQTDLDSVDDSKVTADVSLSDTDLSGTPSLMSRTDVEGHGYASSDSLIFTTCTSSTSDGDLLCKDHSDKLVGDGDCLLSPVDPPLPTDTSDSGKLTDGVSQTSDSEVVLLDCASDESKTHFMSDCHAVLLEDTAVIDAAFTYISPDSEIVTCTIDSDTDSADACDRYSPVCGDAIEITSTCIASAEINIKETFLGMSTSSPEEPFSNVIF